MHINLKLNFTIFKVGKCYKKYVLWKLLFFGYPFYTPNVVLPQCMDQDKS